MECIKCVKKFFLCGFLAGNELDVIDQQYIGRTVFFAEGGRCMRADGGDEVICELFRRDIEHAQTTDLARIANGMEEVGLPEEGDTSST